MKIVHVSPTTLVSAALLVLGSAGCGHSEEEWQAMLNRQRQIEARCQAGGGVVDAPPRPSVQACGRDLDCKGDRICDLGRCVPPR